uniref:tetratricopeptide repeat protein 16-like n=1 Tax=Styela clava TaxID=7725 RepID=UPI00193A3A3C|nr:tetratricopeptide repeat protein 16-like [Styela clava]
MEAKESQIREVTNTKYLVAFDANLKAAYPVRSDSETEEIILKLRQTLATPPPQSERDAEAQKALAVLPSKKVEVKDKNVLKSVIPITDPNSHREILTMEGVIRGKSHEHFNQGIEHSLQGQFEAAITCFNKATNLESRSASFYVERAETFVQLSDFNSAVLNYKHARSLEPHDPNIIDRLAFLYYLQGQCLFDQGLYPSALKSFTSASEMRSSNTAYHMRAIACLAALGRHKECLMLITRILEAQSTANPELYVMRARLHEMFGHSSLCYYDLRDALVLEPLQPQANKLLQELQSRAAESRKVASTLTIEGKLHEAINRTTAAIETDPSVAEFHVFRGALYRRLKNFNAAIDDYMLAMDKTNHDETKPVYKDAQRQLLLTYNDFAVYCYQRGYYEEAVILLNKSIKGEKNEKGLYINRGDCFIKQGDLTFALADYQQALEMDPSSWETKCRIAVVHNELGIISYKEKKYQDALQHFILAIDYNPKVSQFYIHRARARYMNQELQAAQQDVLISLILDPNNNEAVPLASRLFPGRSLTEVLRSGAASDAQRFLQSAIGSNRS